MFEPAEFEMNEENITKTFQLHDILNIQTSPNSYPKAFEDVNWHMGIDNTNPTLSIYIECENYNNSKSYEVDGVIYFISEGIHFCKIFEKEFKTDENRIIVPMIDELRGDQDLTVTVSMNINVKTVKPILPAQKHLVCLIFPHNHSIYVKKSLLRLNSRYFENLNLKFSVTLDEKYEEFLDVLENIYPKNWKTSGLISQKNIGYLIRLAQKYEMTILLEKCEDALKTTIRKEDAVVLADQYKLTGVMNSLMSRFRTEEDLVKFQNLEIYKKLGVETKAGFARKIELLMRSGSDPFTLRFEEAMARWEEPSQDFSGLRVDHQQRLQAPPLIPSQNRRSQSEIRRIQAMEFQQDEYIRMLHQQTQIRLGNFHPGAPGHVPVPPTPWHFVQKFGNQLQNPPMINLPKGFEMEREKDGANPEVRAGPNPEAQQNLEQLQDQPNPRFNEQLPAASSDGFSVRCPEENQIQRELWQIIREDIIEIERARLQNHPAQHHPPTYLIDIFQSRNPAPGDPTHGFDWRIRTQKL
ncbi:unnamed protein product [Caenorhabditis angaria]|uniref:BTB domain-containing protein n=1 Tax=Caenorhabditis angaria TaxID=860376 RepID=A0A9P1ILQ5_9PELO|nr:unnamed protein product [Caenorhabditis angaria]